MIIYYIGMGEKIKGRTVAGCSGNVPLGKKDVQKT